MSLYKTPRKYSFLATLLLVVITEVFAAPKPINYQGYLAQPDGTPIDTTVVIEVELWTAATAGTLLYSESHPAVTISKGRFFIEISTGTPVSGTYIADHFKQDTWLALTINGELLNPRSRLGSVADSHHAEIAERLSTSCTNGEWLGYRNDVLSCYECSSGATRTCYEGDPATLGVGGACRSGTNSCIEGAYTSSCAAQILPIGEICNAVDDDCNGQVDDGTSLPGCLNQYIDTDGDGFGDSSIPVACLCSQSSNTTDIGGDCDDTDPDAKPDQTLYSVFPTNGGGFDYNCNGVIEKDENKTVASCTYNGSSCDYMPGYVNSLPACGEFGTNSTGCTQVGNVCTVTGGGSQKIACR